MVTWKIIPDKTDDDGYYSLIVVEDEEDFVLDSGISLGDIERLYYALQSFLEKER